MTEIEHNSGEIVRELEQRLADAIKRGKELDQRNEQLQRDLLPQNSNQLPSEPVNTVPAPAVATSPTSSASAPTPTVPPEPVAVPTTVAPPAPVPVVAPEAPTPIPPAPEPVAVPTPVAPPAPEPAAPPVPKPVHASEPVAAPAASIPQRPATLADDLNHPLNPAELADLEQLAAVDQINVLPAEVTPRDTLTDSYYSKLSNYDWSCVKPAKKHYYDVFATLDRLEREYLKLTDEDAIILKGREIAEALFAKPEPSHIHLGKFCREAIQAEDHGDRRKKKQYMELLSSILYYAENVHHISDYDLKVLFSTYRGKLLRIQDQQLYLTEHLNNIYSRTPSTNIPQVTPALRTPSVAPPVVQAAPAPVQSVPNSVDTQSGKKVIIPKKLATFN